MTFLQDTAYEAARSFAQHDFMQGFGIRTREDNKDQVTSLKSWGELALRISHWIPGISLYTGFVSLGLAATKIYLNDNQASLQDWSDVARSVLAITGGGTVLAIIDIGTTYLRFQKQKPVDDTIQLQPY